MQLTEVACRALSPGINDPFTAVERVDGPGQALGLLAERPAPSPARLDISVKTVETHKLRAMDKLGFHGRVDVVKHAHRHGWFDGI